MLGYAEGQKAYQLWDPTKQRIIIAESVYFNEDSSFNEITDDSLPFADPFINKDTTIPKQETPKVHSSPCPIHTENTDVSTKPQHTSAPDLPSSMHPDTPSSSQLPLSQENPSISLCPQQVRREPAWLQLNSSEEAFQNAAELPKHSNIAKDSTYYISLANQILKEECAHFAYSAITLNTEAKPKSYKEAMHSPQAEEWQEAIDEEKNSLIALEVFESIKCSDVPRDWKIVGSKMVFKIKQNEKGEISCYKVCIVAKGYSQVPGVDFFNTYAPITHLTSVQMLLAIANARRLGLEQLDVKTAYLYGDLNETIYMEPLEGISTNHNDIWVLKKSLYGLKQSGKAWNDKIHDILTSMGFTCCAGDQCIYIYNLDDIYCALALYVDDILLACNLEEFLDKLKSDLKSNLDIVELGPAKYLLGIEIKHDHNQHTISISQHRYIDEMVERFGMADAKPSPTSMASKHDLSAGTPEDHEEVKDLPYQSLTGSLLYATMATHLDITYTIAQLCKYNSSYTRQHWIAAKHVL